MKHSYRVTLHRLNLAMSTSMSLALIITLMFGRVEKAQ
ncbi:hypothetical protein JCM19235_4625 [Vibrio maritimus]|uniref:Uncharacterized protein n=2 Tax=Vibrio TaxID=662 RepID=A0A090SAJ4_9VIBR|nr:hypothetical protein JCM19235_4625 [Vibrio maritimus]GAL29368.1 hypothetical protein JCM19239_722 [Vibrio variabilis]